MPSPLDALQTLLGGGSANDPTQLYGLLQNRKRELQDNAAKQKALGASAGYAYDQPTLLEATNEQLRSDAANPTAETLRQAPENELMKLLGIQTQGQAQLGVARENRNAAALNAQAQREFQATQNEANRANTRALAATNIQGRSDLENQKAGIKAQGDAQAKALAEGTLADTQAQIEQLKADPNFASMYGTGLGRVAQYLPGSESATTNSRINQLAAEKIINLMSEMKRQSRTGATGFGQLSEKELQLLQNASTKLNNRNIRPEEATAELDKLSAQIQRMQGIIGGGAGSNADEWVTVGAK